MIPIIVNGSPTAKSLSITLKIYPLVFADGTKGLLYIPAENKVTTDILTRKLPSGLVSERCSLLIPLQTISLGFLPSEESFSIFIFFTSIYWFSYHHISQIPVVLATYQNISLCYTPGFLASVCTVSGSWTLNIMDIRTEEPYICQWRFSWVSWVCKFTQQ